MVVNNLKSTYTGGNAIGLAESGGVISAGEASLSHQQLVRTAIHEIGHNLGLKDKYRYEGNKLVSNNPNNLMGISDSYNLTAQQKAIVREGFITGSAGACYNNTTKSQTLKSTKSRAYDFIQRNNIN